MCVDQFKGKSITNRTVETIGLPSELAIALARALRSAGVPVWLDWSDLPPGDTERRLEEAMQSGLSGAVLLVTPDIGASSVVKEIELPHLLALEAEGAFTLSIGSTIESEAGGLDYSAPDRLLSRTVPNLRGLRQDPALTSRDIAGTRCGFEASVTSSGMYAPTEVENLIKRFEEGDIPFSEIIYILREMTETFPAQAREICNR